MPQHMETGKKNKSGKDTGNWKKPTKIHEKENRWTNNGIKKQKWENDSSNRPEGNRPMGRFGKIDIRSITIGARLRKAAKEKRNRDFKQAKLNERRREKGTR